MKFKKGDKVIVPKGTPVATFSGSILDKNPFNTSPMGYDAIGILKSISDDNIHIDIWDTGRTYPWIANIDKKYLNSFSSHNYILWYDYEIDICRVFDPKNLPLKGSREYEVGFTRPISNDNGIGEETVSYTVWACSRKEAFNELRKTISFEKEKNKCYEFKARLVYSKQTPFDHKIVFYA